MAGSRSSGRRSLTFPYKFEAGTPHIAGAIGLAAALDYLTAIGIERVAAYEDELLSYATDALSEVPGLRLTGTAPAKASVLSFVLGDVHPHDVGTILDREGVAVRAGHHCCQPLMARLGVPATARASLAAVQHARGRRRARRRAAHGPGGVRVSAELQDLYQEVILDHNRRPRNFRAIETDRRPKASIRCAATASPCT